jgi:coenzyme F420-reducing hydrogenase gamma subunit
MEGSILDLLGVVQPVEWREAMSDKGEKYDIALIEGSITRPEDAERLKEIRQRSGVLVALGSCATHGGVNRLKNAFSMEDVKTCVYGGAAAMPHLATAPTQAVDEVVKVDFKVYGCPMSKREFAYIVRCLAVGKTPMVPTHPVCVECKRNENVCRYEYNEVCLGPVTRAGCGAKCPTAGAWCFGCRGLVDDPNVDAARDVMDHYGKTMSDLDDRMALFNTKRG